MGFRVLGPLLFPPNVKGTGPNRYSESVFFIVRGDFLSLLPLLRGRALAAARVLAPTLAFAPASAALLMLGL